MTAPTAPIELPIITIAGDAQHMGKQLAEACGDSIHAFVQGRLNALRANLMTAKRGRLADFMRVAEASMDILRDWDAEGFAELEACAQTLGLPLADLVAAANLTDLRDVVLYGEEAWRGDDWTQVLPADAEGCSSVAQHAKDSATGAQLLGQSWDLNPQDLDHVIALRRRPNHGPASWTITCAGCPAIVGLNEEGVYVGTTNLKTYGGRPGVGYVHLIYRALRATTAEDAAERIRNAPRVAAHSYLVADAQQALELECDHEDVFSRPLKVGQALCRSNHCLDPAMTRKQAEPSTPSSIKRLAMLQQSTAGALDAASLRQLFADRSDGIHSINRYPEDNEGTATNAVIIYDASDAGSPCLQACRGPADRGVWQRLGFD